MRCVAPPPAGTGPLAEIEFWRERNAVLSALYEQLNLPHVKRMVQVWQGLRAFCLPASYLP
jgi:dynein heavy chain